MKERQSNIELCRIISMLLVILVHSNFAWTGAPQNLPSVTFFRFLVQSFSIIGVNVFVLITGYFSTTIKKKSIVNIFYICLFYSLLRIIYSILMGCFNIKDVFFISNSNWFIVCYIGLLLFTPYLSTLKNKKSLVITISCLLIYEVYFGFFPSIVVLDPGINQGYSIFSFIVLYLIGRYIKLFGVPNILRKLSFIWYLVLSFFIALLSYFSFTQSDVLGLSKTAYVHFYDYENPLVILSSVCFFLTFEKQQIRSNRIINHISKSVLAVLLIHGSSIIEPLLASQFNYLRERFSGILLVRWSCCYFFSINRNRPNKTSVISCI